MFRFIYIFLTACFLFGCYNTIPSKTQELSYSRQFDPGIIGISIEGITVGMSPRRVLHEYHENGWRLDRLNTITMEDMVEEGIDDAHFYISTNETNESDLEVFFRENCNLPEK